MKKIIRSVIVILIFMIISGCSSKINVKKAQLNILIGLHNNSKQMTLNCLSDELKDVILNYGVVDMNFIIIDGNPFVADTLSVSLPNNISERKKEQLADGYTEEIISFTNGFEPKEENTDVFKALKVSSYLSEDESYDSHMLFIIDTLLPSSGVVDLSSFDFVNVQNEEIIDFVKDNYNIDLSSYDLIECYGLGQVDSPQKELSFTYLNKLENFYSKFFKGAGYKCDSDSIFNHSVIFNAFDQEKYKKLPFVRVIEDEGNKTFIANYVTSIDCDTYFEANSAEIRDDINIDSLLIEISRLNKDKRYIICGTTSSYGDEVNRKRLSEDRAATIRDLMIDEGFGSEYLCVFGGSINTSFYINDRIDGELIEDLAALNRKVFILEDNEESHRLIKNE